MAEKDRPGWLNGERSGLQALIPSLRGTFRANAKRYYRLDLKQERLRRESFTKSHIEAKKHSRRATDPGVGHAAAQQATKGGRPVSASKFSSLRPGCSIPVPYSADIRIIVLDSPKHMRSEGLAPPLAYAPLRPPSATKPPKAPVPTRRPLSASVYRPPTLGPPQPARPTSANPNADVQHWGHVRRSSAPASYTAEAERQGGRGSRGMHTSNEMYALYRQVQTQGRLPAFGLTSGYNGGSLTGESLEVAAEDSIEAGPRPPSAISAVRVQVHQCSPSSSRRHSQDGGAPRHGGLYQHQGREEDDESMPSLDQTSIQRLIEGLGLPARARACYQPPPPVTLKRPLSAGRTGHVRSASNTPRMPRRAGSETDLRNLTRPRSQTPTNSTGAALPRPSSARIVRTPQRASAAPPRPQSANPAARRPISWSPRTEDSTVSPRTSFQRRFRAGELNLLASAQPVSDAPSSQRAGPIKQDVEQWSEDGAAVVYDDDSSSGHQTNSSKEPSDRQRSASGASGGSKGRTEQPQERARGSKGLMIVGTSAAHRVSASQSASSPSVSSIESGSMKGQVKLKEGKHHRVKTVATLTGRAGARPHSPVNVPSPEMLAADSIVSVMEVVGKSSGHKPMTRMADRQQQTQAQRKEPEVPMCDQSSEMVHGADEALDEAQKDRCDENVSMGEAAAGSEPTVQAQQPPLPPTSADNREPEGGATRATEQEEAEQVQHAEERSSTPTAVPNKRVKKGQTRVVQKQECMPPRPPRAAMTCGVQAKATNAETREGGGLKKSAASRGRSKLPRRPSSAGSKAEVADKAVQERAARRRSSMRSNEVEGEEREVTQMTTGEANVTNVRYWDSFAHTWNDEIMDSIKEDLHGVIIGRLADYCVADSTVAVDFGCGVGRYLPHLASRCKKVYAVDISSALVDKARRNCQGAQYSNVQFEVLDVGASEWGKGDAAKPYPSTLLSPSCANMVVCTNVVISPEPLTRRAILHNISQILCPGGFLLLLVPSVESAIMVRRRHTEWLQYRRSRKMRSLGEKEKLEETSAADERLGVFRRGGVRTKHYRASDLEPLLRQAGLKRLSMDRVEYDWSTELSPPTAWMKGPHPWDWLVVARRSSLLSRNQVTAAVEGGEVEGQPIGQEV